MKKLAVFIIGIFLLIPLTVHAETVIFNPNSKIYHSTTCSSALKCKTCIKTDKIKAKNQGGRPCKKCGG